MNHQISQIDRASRRLRVIDAVVREVEHPVRTRLGPRWQVGVQMVLVHAGSMRVRIDDQPEYVVGAGHMCLLLPSHSEVIRYTGDEASRETIVSGTLDGLTDDMLTWLEALRPTRPLSAALTYLAREAVVTEQTRLTANGALIDALATSLLWRFIAEFENFPAALPVPIEKARLFIHNHVTEDIALDDIAGAAFVAPAHLVRLFREHMSTTPIRYLWDRRITLGIELLTNTELTISSVAERSGFKTSFHFARRIRAATGLTPTELRVTRRAPEAGIG